MATLYIFLTRSVQKGTTALMVAAMNGHVRAVGLLIAAKARVNIQSKVRLLLVGYSLCIFLCTGWLDGIAHGRSEGSPWSN